MDSMKKTITDSIHILLLGDIGRPPVRDILRGLLKYSRLHSAGWILYINSPYYDVPDLKKITPENIRKWGICGIVDILRNPSKTTEILSIDLPSIVLVGTQKNALGQHIIVCDNAEVSEMGAKYFLDKKFVDFAYCGIDSKDWSQERGEIFVKAVIKAGHRVHLYKQPHGKSGDSWEKELPFMVKWLKALPKPVGLMTCSDYRGNQILEACGIAKLQVPDDIAILSVGNEDIICEMARPPLSSVNVCWESAGYRAGEILNRLMNSEKLPPQKLLAQPIAIFERQSTDVLAINDKEVKQAVRFIHRNSMKPISVTDVAEAVSMTIRTLDRRFKKILGRSVHSEISRMRIKQVCHMLVETNLSVSQIALKLGYSDPPHLNRAFKREKGMGPLAYRQTYTAI